MAIDSEKEAPYFQAFGDAELEKELERLSLPISQEHEYVPLNEIFAGMNAKRINYLVEHLQPYVEKYREDRKETQIEDYIRLRSTYLEEVRGAIIKELEVEKIEPRKKILKGALIASIGYAVTVPLIIAVPALIPYLFPEVMVSFIAEESVRNIYHGVKDKKRIEKEITLVNAMPAEDFAYALEDICYYPALTDHDRSALTLTEENKKLGLETLGEAGKYVAHALYESAKKHAISLDPKDDAV